MKAAVPLFALAMLLIAPGCSGSRPAPAARPPVAATTPPKPRAPTPAPPVAAPLPVSPSVGWTEAALTPGSWRYQDFGPGMGKRALFLFADDTEYFSLDCVTYPNGPEILFTRTGRPARPALTMTIRTETMSRALAARRFGPQITTVAVPAADPLLDAMALSKGRFAVEVEGEAPLYLPSWAEVSRVIEDCRS
jgi:hypothetical protein